MSSHTIFILGLILFDGLAVGLAAWQYWTVRPAKPPKPEPPAAASAEDPGHPEG
jgi:hypothetical protein